MRLDGPKLGSCRDEIVANETEAVHHYRVPIGSLNNMTIAIEGEGGANQVYSSVLVRHISGSWSCLWTCSL
jgi:hypothetical protein